MCVSCSFIFHSFTRRTPYEYLHAYHCCAFSYHHSHGDRSNCCQHLRRPCVRTMDHSRAPLGRLPSPNKRHGAKENNVMVLGNIARTVLQHSLCFAYFMARSIMVGLALHYPDTCTHRPFSTDDMDHVACQWERGEDSHRVSCYNSYLASHRINDCRG